MKLKHSAAFASFLTVILAFLGFSACEPGGGETPCEYGTPTADYKLDITVVDEAGAPIPAIKVSGGIVRVENTDDYILDKNEYSIDPHEYYTDKDGKVKAHFSGFPHGEPVIYYLEDVDGEANGGSFQSDSVYIELKKTADGSGTWDKGTYEGSARKILKKSDNPQTPPQE